LPVGTKFGLSTIGVNFKYKSQLQLAKRSNL
jgi:hypothetical protein